MSPPTEYSCPRCHAVMQLRNARAFTLVTCEACGTQWRPRTVIGGYRLLEPLVRSGLAVTFRAIAPATNDSLAVKIIRPPFDAESHDFERFIEDVRLLAAFQHPHWVRTFGGGIEDGVAWIAMEWPSHGSLANLLADHRPLSEADALRFAIQAASALAAAKTVGLSHRNIHPGNLLLTETNSVKVGGFAEAIFHARVGRDLGTVWGRLCCVPPERLFGASEDARSEIYALGTVLFEMLTGSPPYCGEAMIEIFLDHLEGPPLRLTSDARSFTKRTKETIERMLALDPDDRFQSWAEVLAQLEANADELSPRGSKIATRPPAVAMPASNIQLEKAKARGIRVAITMLAAIGLIICGYLWWRGLFPAL